MTQAPGWLSAVESLSKKNLEDLPFLSYQNGQSSGYKEEHLKYQPIDKKCIIMLIKAWMVLIKWILVH